MIDARVSGERPIDISRTPIAFSYRRNGSLITGLHVQPISCSALPLTFLSIGGYPFVSMVESLWIRGRHPSIVLVTRTPSKSGPEQVLGKAYEEPMPPFVSTSSTMQCRIDWANSGFGLNYICIRQEITAGCVTANPTSRNPLSSKASAHRRSVSCRSPALGI